MALINASLAPLLVTYATTPASNMRCARAGSNREADDADVGTFGVDAAGRLDAVKDRHGNVHRDHVRLQLAGEVDGDLAVPRLPDDLDVGFLREQLGETGGRRALKQGPAWPIPLDHVG